MGQEEVDRIKNKFFKLNLNPTYLEHEEVITSEDAARTRGFELKQGIKSILFTNGEEWVVVNVPADKKVDSKKVASKLGWSNNKTRIGNEEEVMIKTGCKIGAVPPFGHNELIKIFVDEKVYDNKISTFNIGLREVSVKIQTEEMKVVFNNLNAIEGDFVKE
ncbi:YbaK/EbsC family protein [Candidatus Pacearchaeota archaeon]|nr:YbaK/EbsC family protein [Candidatus Pacearchaeota archaeon]